ncbi:SDR family oxidoreductase [Candidatus Nitrososphaera sp. FF02]|uniref:SDR family oxidoreductase n=1 Tax=Candidatus Nitrososphaera sp. FF02 TaxID=3398226 RepID=UPI0039E8584D
MNSRVCLVTGATSGIGKEIASGLARLGATVVFVGRDGNKCEAVLREIVQRHPGSDVSYIVSDLSSQESVRGLAAEFLAKHSSLHVLVNNAGVFAGERAATADGIEMTFAVNHLAPFLLTHLLSSRLKTSAPARVITTSSVAHRGARIDFDDPQFEKRQYGGIAAYGQSKLANILFTRELARRLADRGVTANCFHPGAVKTDLMEGNPLLYRAAWAAASPFLLSPEKGADTGVYLASSPEVEQVTGRYFVKRKISEPSEAARDDEAAARLWTISEELTGVA